MIKRLSVTLALTGALLAGVATVAHADTFTSYDIPDANLNMSVPDSWAMVTRDKVLAHPEIIQQTGLDDAEVEQLMLQSNAYADVIAPGGETETMAIVVDPNKGDDRIWNLHECSDTLLKTLGDQTATQMKSANYDATFEGTYKNGDLTYLILSGTSTADTDFYRQYYTIVNSRMTSITMHSYTTELTDDQLATLKQIVDSVKFLSVTQDPNPSLGLFNTGSIVTWIMGGAITAVVVAAAVIIIVVVTRNRRRKRAIPVPFGPGQGV